MYIGIAIITFIISLTMGAFLIPWLVKLCLSMGWVDAPNHRKVHREPVPRLGGLAFLPCTAFSFIITSLIENHLNDNDVVLRFSTVCMVVGAMTIYIVGLFDDVQELKANTKFIIQTCAALIFPFCNLYITNLHGFLGIYELPYLVSYPLTVFIILLITNSMNLIDGIDGLASGLSILILATYAFLFYRAGHLTFTLIAMSTLGSVSSFFCYNVWGTLGRNKTFMGDSGSLFLGYIISYLSIKYQMVDSYADSYDGNMLLTAFTLVIIPTFDVIRVAISRKLRGIDMFTPDKTHIHHRFMAAGMTMHQALVAILLFFCFFCGLNYCLYGMELNLAFIVLCDVIFYSAVLELTSLLKK